MTWFPCIYLYKYNYTICNTMYMYLSCPWFVRKKPVVVADGNSACPRLEDSVSYLWESIHLNNQHLILRSWHVCLCAHWIPHWQVLLVQSHKISMNPPWNLFFFVNSPCFWWLASLCSFGPCHGCWMFFESPMTPMMLLVATVNLPCGIFRTTNGLKTSNDKIKWTTGGSINVQSGMPQ